MRARLVLARAAQIVLRRTACACSASPRRSGCSSTAVRVIRVTADLRVHPPIPHVRSRRRFRRARFRRNAVRQGRQRARRIGHVLLRLAPAILAGAARRRRRRRLSRWTSSSRSRQRGVDMAGLEQATGESFRWRGRYRHDLNSAETLETQLGVFSHFSPKIPEQFRNAPFVFLANIDPRLQLDVLRPGGEAEARGVRHDELLDREPPPGHHRAAQARGPHHAERRRGAPAHGLRQPREGRAVDHGARAAASSSSRRASTARSCSRRQRSSSRRRIRWRTCSIPPAPAIRSPAASWATSRATGDLSDANLRRAVVVRIGHGLVRRGEVLRCSACWRSRAPTSHARVRGVPAARGVRGGARAVSGERTSGRWTTPSRASTSSASDDVKQPHSRASWSPPSRRARAARSAASAACSACPPRPSAPVLVSSADGVGTKIKVAIEADRHDTVGHDLVNHCDERHPRAGRRAAVLPRLRRVRQARAGGGRGGGDGHRSRLPGERLLRWSAARPPRCRASTRRPITISPGSSSGAWRRTRSSAPTACEEGDVLVGLASSGLHTNGYSLARRIVAERMGLGVHDAFPGRGRHGGGRAAARCTGRTCRRCDPCSARIHAMAHITGGGLPGNVNRALPDTLDAVVDACELGGPEPRSGSSSEAGAGRAGRDVPHVQHGSRNGRHHRRGERAATSRRARRRLDIAAWRLGRVVRGHGPGAHLLRSSA